MEQQAQVSNATVTNKKLTHLVYLLQAGFFVTGISLLVAFLINIFRRKHVDGTLFEHHFNWQIQTFKYVAGLILVPFLLIIAIIYAGIGATGGEEFRTVYEMLGIPALIVANLYAIAVAIFLIYRIYTGWSKLIEEKEV